MNTILSQKTSFDATSQLSVSIPARPRSASGARVEGQLLGQRGAAESVPASRPGTAAAEASARTLVQDLELCPRRSAEACPRRCFVTRSANKPRADARLTARVREPRPARRRSGRLGASATIDVIPGLVAVPVSTWRMRATIPSRTSRWATPSRVPGLRSRSRPWRQPSRAAASTHPSVAHRCRRNKRISASLAEYSTSGSCFSCARRFSIPSSRSQSWMGFPRPCVQWCGAGRYDVPPALLSNPPRRDPELSRGRRLDERKVLRVVGRVMHGLASNHAAVPDEVREQPEPMLRPAQPRCQRLPDPTRDRHPVT